MGQAPRNQSEMMTDERYKAIMVALGQPNSRSLLQALQQVANEVAQETQAAERERYANLLRQERELSDAYVRLRLIIGAMDPPTVTDARALWAYVEGVARQKLEANVAGNRPPSGGPGLPACYGARNTACVTCHDAPQCGHCGTVPRGARHDDQGQADACL